MLAARVDVMVGDVEMEESGDGFARLEFVVDRDDGFEVALHGGPLRLVRARDSGGALRRYSIYSPTASSSWQRWTRAHWLIGTSWLRRPRTAA